MVAGSDLGLMGDGARGPLGWPLYSAEFLGPGLKRAMNEMMSDTSRQVSRAVTPTCRLQAHDIGIRGDLRQKRANTSASKGLARPQQLPKTHSSGLNKSGG